MPEEICIHCGDPVPDYTPDICCENWTIYTDCCCGGNPLNAPICGDCGGLEQWRPVVGYEDVYEISNMGRIKRIKRSSSTWNGRIIKPSISVRRKKKVEVEWERGEKETCFKDMWFLKTKYQNNNIGWIEKKGEKYRIGAGKGYKYFNHLDDAKKAIEKRFKI